MKSWKGGTISDSMYYYGCESSQWDNMNYFDAIKDRRDRAFALFGQFLDESLSGKQTYEFQVRSDKVYQAYRLNEKLIDEREGTE